jgi:hypothetical protein
MILKNLINRGGGQHHRNGGHDGGNGWSTSIGLYTNGKTGKQALIAFMNKLLKQVFAVVKNNSLYQPNYCSTLH